MACSAFAVTAMDDDQLECQPAGAAANAGRAQEAECQARTPAHRSAAKPAGKAGGHHGGGDGVPHGGGPPPAPPPGVPQEAEGVYDHERCGNTSGRVLLTLDDWAYSDPERPVRIGAQLQAQGVRAAFFLINKYAAQYPQVASTLRQQGHWVGNHTVSHRHLPSLTDEESKDEIRGGVTGNLLRPPYGDFGEREKEIAAEAGMRICNWTIDTHDWEKTQGNARSADDIRASVRDATPEEKHNGVVLGHLFSNYPEALAGIITDLQAQGYQMCRNTGPVGEQVPNPLAC
ncbi:hypothetical protein BLA24_09405 [Streptomyces cinnamoneus]|uniref:NodB homology domain-containing protein n=1 Tax=Streptomyces cinnamoneus TaxID=53446 RepID=A0A2G1XLM7_STRCJ|nr:hypothetical protein BLA24_09405 [Streptomyces cinnamoneus]PPT16207.1 polysaccharide deacetylase family protein [Streptomyces cinnamoneus]